MSYIENVEERDGITGGLKFNIRNKIDKLIIEILQRYNCSSLDLRNPDNVIGKILYCVKDPYSRTNTYSTAGKKHMISVLKKRNERLEEEIKLNKLYIQMCQKKNVEIIDKTKTQ